MKPQLTGKALVAAGHLLAKQIGPNTLPKDTSALISALSTYLDVALARCDLLQQQANQLATENAKATEVIDQCKSYFIAGITNRVRPTNEGYLHMLCDTFKDESPATGAVLNSLRAEGVELFAQEKIMLRDKHAENGDSGMVKANDYCAMSAEEFANQLRVDAAKDGE